MPGDNLQKKAALLEEGNIFIPDEKIMPCFASRSSAGPDAGVKSYAFEFNGSKVKLEVSKDPEARFWLSEEDEDFFISEWGEKFIDAVKVLPTLAHAPNQAFVNLNNQCIFGCKFCSAPAMERGPGMEMSSERVLRIVNIASRYPGFEAVAITSGVPDSAAETNRRIAGIIKEIRNHYPELPIGVEAYVEDLSDIRMFRDAGADEVKINIEVWPENLFELICPSRDQEKIFNALEKAVQVFGRGQVASNIIIGLGERDEDVEECVGMLADGGIVANIRGLRINKLNENTLKDALDYVPERVKAERLISLATMHKGILEANDLSTLSFKTMCFSCECCDIVPMRDL